MEVGFHGEYQRDRRPAPPRVDRGLRGLPRRRLGQHGDARRGRRRHDDDDARPARAARSTATASSPRAWRAACRSPSTASRTSSARAPDGTGRGSSRLRDRSRPDPGHAIVAACRDDPRAVGRLGACPSSSTTRSSPPATPRSSATWFADLFGVAAPEQLRPLLAGLHGQRGRPRLRLRRRREIVTPSTTPSSSPRPSSTPSTAPSSSAGSSTGPIRCSAGPAEINHHDGGRGVYFLEPRRPLPGDHHPPVRQRQ